MTAPSADIHVAWDGTTVSTHDILQWEARHASHALARLRGQRLRALLTKLDLLLRRSRMVSAADGERTRRELVDLKLALGPERLHRILRRDLALSRLSVKAMLLGQRDTWAMTTIDITSSHGDAAGFPAWFEACVEDNVVEPMLAANPDHFVIDSSTPRRQYVVETTGGSPLVSAFTIEMGDNPDLPVVLDPDRPHRIVGRAVGFEGQTIGWACHQFGDVAGGGFTGTLCIVWPRRVLPSIRSGHRWHLACEFSNWIGAYLDTAR